MTPATTIQEVINQLEQIITDCENKGMRHGYFAALYLRVTKEVQRKINEKYFDDNERMEKLDVVFANRYLIPYYQYQQKQPCIKSWQLAFDACNRWSPLVIQHLFTGMNAHIGLDLGIAAAITNPGSSIGQLQNDFNKINTILSGLVDTVQEEISDIWYMLKPIDWLAGRMDEEATVFSMTIARNSAWKTALQYASLTEKDEQEKFILLRDQQVAAFGKNIIQPRLPINLYINVFRLGEYGTIQKKINRLNRA